MTLIIKHAKIISFCNCSKLNYMFFDAGLRDHPYSLESPTLTPFTFMLHTALEHHKCF